MVTTLKIIPSVGGHYILSHLRLHQEGVFINRGDIEHECSHTRKKGNRDQSSAGLYANPTISLDRDVDVRRSDDSQVVSGLRKSVGTTLESRTAEVDRSKTADDQSIDGSLSSKIGVDHGSRTAVASQYGTAILNGVDIIDHRRRICTSRWRKQVQLGGCGTCTSRDTYRTSDGGGGTVRSLEARRATNGDGQACCLCRVGKKGRGEACDGALSWNVE